MGKDVIPEDMRVPLERGHTVRMDSGAVYFIEGQISWGGYSLVYDAVSNGGTSSWIIKEFYPLGESVRDAEGNIVPDDGCQDKFLQDLERFWQEVDLGGKLSDQSSQILSLKDKGDRCAAMPKHSRDMISLEDLLESWQNKNPLPLSGEKKDIDPVFPDLVRVGYALRIAESLLSVISVVHEQGYLHLDISSNNVLWAGQDLETGRNCTAYLADFGNARKLVDGCYQPEGALEATRLFQAPEMWDTAISDRLLSPATDLYSVGILLYYLITGDHILHGRESRHIQRKIQYQRLPESFRKALWNFLSKATAWERTQRFQSANEMKNQVRRLSEMIPPHPVNPDHTDAFTLYSLRSMLEGSRGSHYSWAHELKDRRNVSGMDIPDQVCEPLTDQNFSTDMDFLNKILPDFVFRYIVEQVSNAADQAHAIDALMGGNYETAQRNDLCRLFRDYGMDELLTACRTLLHNKKAFFVDQDILFRLLGREGERLWNCYYNCSGGEPPYVGLAIFTVYALLGPDGFAQLVPSPESAEAGELFHPL